MCGQGQHYVEEKVEFLDLNDDDLLRILPFYPGNSTMSDQGQHTTEQKQHTTEQQHATEQEHTTEEQHTAVEKFELLELHYDELLHIVPFLKKKDLLAVSKTCTHFKDVCLSKSSLWRYFSVKFGKEDSSVEHSQENSTKVSCPTKLELTDYDKEVLKFSGDRIQTMCVTLNLYDRNAFFDQQSLDSLINASQHLKEFKFHVEGFALFDNVGDHIINLSAAFSEFLTECLTGPGSARLQTLSLQHISWREPIFRTLLKILHSETLCKNVIHLLLDFFVSSIRPAYAKILYEKSYQTSCDYGKALAKFKNVQILQIKSLYLTNCLFEALCQSGNASLRTLSVVVDCFHECIDLTAWTMLLESFPSLKVVIAHGSVFVDEIDFRRALPARVPVVRWDVYCCEDFGTVSSSALQNVFNLLCVYSKTLKTVKIKSSSHCLSHSALLKMVAKCSKLRSFKLAFSNCMAKISCNTILEIVALRRKWLKLYVEEISLGFPKSWGGNEKECIKRLSAEVSEKLGYEWKPSKLNCCKNKA